MGSLKFITTDGTPKELPITREEPVVFYSRDEFGGGDGPAVTILAIQKKSYEIPLHYHLVKMELGPHYANSSPLSTRLSPESNYDLASVIIDRGYAPTPMPKVLPEATPLRPVVQAPERPLGKLVAAA